MAPRPAPARAAESRHGLARRRRHARGKPSGLPFHAQFANVAAAAGLRAPVIYGDEGKADYILESMGCGAAFLDYDNDGWLDIVMLTGRRRTGPTPADATIRLYHNNRDGTFTRRHRAVRAWAAACGPPASRSATTITTASTISSSPAGARTSCFTTRATARSRTSRRRRDCCTRARATAPAAPGSITIATAGSISSSRITLVFDPDKIPPRGKDPGVQLQRRSGLLRARRDFRRSSAVCTTTTATAPSPMSASKSGIWPSSRAMR